MDENKTTMVEDIGKIGVGAAILAGIDYFLGDIWLFIVLALGIYGTQTAAGMSLSGLKGMIEKSGGSPKAKETWQKMWYQANVPPNSEERIPNPTKEQIAEYIAWREEQERLAKERETTEREEAKVG
mgnify:CR=1 FL=1